MTSLFSKLSRPSFVSAVAKLPTVRANFIPSTRYVSSESSKKSSITWTKVTLVSVTTGALLYWLKSMKDEKDQKDAIERKRQLAKTAIGGSFELVNHENKKITSEDLRGQWLLIYFGFTHCPDICPDELEKISKTVDIIDKNPNIPNVVPVFISVDPERDTPEIIGKYISEFSPKFLGLTGSPEQIDKVCKSYRVYYNAGPKDFDKDYIVDHTIIIYLINPEGEFMDYYGQNRAAEEVAQGIEIQMTKYKKMNQATGNKLFSLVRANNVQSS